MRWGWPSGSPSCWPSSAEWDRNLHRASPVEARGRDLHPSHPGIAQQFAISTSPGASQGRATERGDGVLPLLVGPIVLSASSGTGAWLVAITVVRPIVITAAGAPQPHAGFDAAAHSDRRGCWGLPAGAWPPAAGDPGEASPPRVAAVRRGRSSNRRPKARAVQLPGAPMSSATARRAPGVSSSRSPYSRTVARCGALSRWYHRGDAAEQVVLPPDGCMCS